MCMCARAHPGRVLSIGRVPSAGTDTPHAQWGGLAAQTLRQPATRLQLQSRKRARRSCLAAGARAQHEAPRGARARLPHRAAAARPAGRAALRRPLCAWMRSSSCGVKCSRRESTPNMEPSFGSSPASNPLTMTDLR
jgi:hypothetical protein